MKLYYSKGTCSLAIRILINELALPCDYESVDLKTKQTKSGQDFLKINPKGAVPALEIDNQGVLTENAVIQQYLVDHYNATHLLPAVSNFQRYRVLEWLNFVSTEMHKGCSPFFNASLTDEVKTTVFRPLLQKKLSYVDHSLQQDYLCGKTFTLPDIYLFVVLSWLPHIGFNLEDYKNIQRYFDDLKQRPAILKSLKDEHLIK